MANKKQSVNKNIEVSSTDRYEGCWATKSVLDTVSMYKADVAAAKCENPEEERRVMADILAGMEKTATPEARKKCAEARKRLIEMNADFVPVVAGKLVKQFLPKNGQHRDSLMQELIAEGNLGLTEAARFYDPSKGVKFTSYAHNRIFKYIYISLNRTVSCLYVPYKTAVSLQKLRQAISEFTTEYHREATPDELSRITNFSYRQIKSLLGLKSGYVRLDIPAGKDDKGKPRYEFEDLARSQVKDVAEEAIRRLERKRVMRYLDILSQRERDILWTCTALDKPRRVMAKKYDVTEERVRQINNGAIKKIRKALKISIE